MEYLTHNSEGKKIQGVLVPKKRHPTFVNFKIYLAQQKLTFKL